MPRSHVARVTVVLTMDDGARVVYLLEGNSKSEATVHSEINYDEIRSSVAVKHTVASYDLTFEFKHMVASDVTTEPPGVPALEAGAREITDTPTGP